jgi:5'-3' exonuclease
MRRLLIVDHNALLHRCRNALLRTGRKYTTSTGIPTTGVFSYLSALLSIIEKTSCTHVVVCFDAGSNARKTESDTYKANRKPLEPDFIAENRILLNEALYALGIESIGLKGFEADDIIHTLSVQGQKDFDEIIIATVDQDLLQCVTETTKVLLWNSAKKQVLMDGAAVMDKWRVEPDDIRFIKALSGDSSDNIKGIKGVGPKTATKIFYEAQGLLEFILKNEKVFPHQQQFLDNLSLVTLKYMKDELGDPVWSDYEVGLGMQSDWEQFLSEYELNGLAKRVAKTTELMKLRG